MGSFQARKPLLGKEGVEPALWQQPRAHACFVPRFEGRQQPCCPLQRFDPERRGLGPSDVDSPCGHYHRFVVRCHELHVSTFLHPFAPPELPGFFATMGALTPGRAALRLGCLVTGFELRPGIPAFCHRIFRSFCLQPPSVAPTPFWGFLRRAYRTTGLWSPLRGHASLGLRRCPAGSPRRPAESSSLALRTDRSPPVALHPASRRRSYHRLRDTRIPRQGLSPC